jgi:hypothetical protein
LLCYLRGPFLNPRPWAYQFFFMLSYATGSYGLELLAPDNGLIIKDITFITVVQALMMERPRTEILRPKLSPTLILT